MPQPNKIPLAFASSGDKNTIPENTQTTGLASWREGFPAITSAPFSEGGIAPKRADFNGIFYALSQAVMWMQQGGVYAYDVNTDYEAGNVVLDAGGLYVANSANGPSSAVVQPSSDTTGATWKPLRLDLATQAAAGYMSAADKARLDSVILTDATQSAAGYMSAEDKATLDNVSTTYLPRSGGELSGALGIKTNAAGNSAIQVINPDATKGTAPSTKRYISVGLYGNSHDSYEKRLGVVETVYETDRSVSTSIGAYVADSPTNTDLCEIVVHTAADGTKWTSAPTPPTSDSSTKIATTAYVQANISDVERVVNYLGNYYIRYSSGLQICMSYLNVSASGSQITYPLPFVTDPIVLITPAPRTNTADTYIFVPTARSGTGCTIYANKNGSQFSTECYYMAIGQWK